MTTYFHHDPQGKIKGAVVFHGNQRAGLMLTPKPGLLVTKVAEVKFKSENPSHGEISDIIRNFKIDTSNPASLIE